jgi:oligoribonuclease
MLTLNLQGDYSMAFKYAQALCWIDLETTSLDMDEGGILEIAVIVTDFDLKPYFGYSGVVAMNNDLKHSLSLAQNQVPLKMHLASGLLKESKDSEYTLAVIEAEIIEMLKTRTTFEKGEFMLAGSGVATFDMQWLKKHMPELHSWVAYYPFDIGVVRRAAKILSGGKDLINPVTESFGSNKSHRALDDVKAHIKEAGEFKKFFRWAAEKQESE